MWTKCILFYITLALLSASAVSQVPAPAASPPRVSSAAPPPAISPAAPLPRVSSPALSPAVSHPATPPSAVSSPSGSPPVASHPTISPLISTPTASSHAPTVPPLITGTTTSSSGTATPRANATGSASGNVTSHATILSTTSRLNTTGSARSSGNATSHSTVPSTTSRFNTTGSIRSSGSTSSHSTSIKNTIASIKNTITSNSNTKSPTPKAPGSHPTTTLPVPTTPTITVETTQSVAPIPTASVASVPNVSVANATQQDVQYQGNWSTTQSSCDSSVTAMISQDPLSFFSYSFKSFQDGSVYLDSTRNPDAGVFVVILDDLQTKIDGFSAMADNSCTFTWFQSGLAAGLHNLSVSFVGPSPQAQQLSGSFELNGIQLVGQDTSTIVTPNNGRSLLAEMGSMGFFIGLLGISFVQGF